MKLSELKKMATENGISLKHLTGKMLKKSELAEKLMTKGVMVKSPKKSRKTSRKPKKTSRKPVKKSRKPKKTSRKPKKTSRKPKKTSRKPVKKSRKPVKKSRKPKKVRKYKAKTVVGKGMDIGSAMTKSLKHPTTGLNWTRSIRGGSRWRNVLGDVDKQWGSITLKIRELLTTERNTDYKIGRNHRLDHIKNPNVVGVKFVYSISEGGWWGKPKLVGICEMNISLGDDGVPKFNITEGTLQNLDNINEGTLHSTVGPLVENKQIYNVVTTAKLITERVKTAFGIID